MEKSKKDVRNRVILGDTILRSITDTVCRSVPFITHKVTRYKYIYGYSETCFDEIYSEDNKYFSIFIFSSNFFNKKKFYIVEKLNTKKFSYLKFGINRVGGIKDKIVKKVL